MIGKKLAGACQKLDHNQSCLEKLIAFIDEAEIKSLTIVTMHLSCPAGGLWDLAQEAASKAYIKLEIVAIDGRLQ